jgi:hypothetical protein
MYQIIIEELVVSLSTKVFKKQGVYQGLPKGKNPLMEIQNSYQAWLIYSGKSFLGN